MLRTSESHSKVICGLAMTLPFQRQGDELDQLATAEAASGVVFGCSDFKVYGLGLGV